MTEQRRSDTTRSDDARVVIARLGEADSARFKALRLASLADAPDAYGTTLAEAEAWPDAVWRDQLQATATFVAERHGRDVGVARGAVDDTDATRAWLRSMWVAPDARRHGIGHQLVEAVTAWARHAGCSRLALDVTDSNLGATRFYTWLGFIETGVTGNVDPARPHLTEHQRERRI